MSRAAPPPRSAVRQADVRAWLLVLLAERDAHGYELQSQLEQMGVQPVVGAVYRMLRGLEGDGFVKAEWRSSTSGPDRRVYRLLARGRRELDDTATVIADRRRLLNRYLARHRALPPSRR